MAAFRVLYGFKVYFIAPISVQSNRVPCLTVPFCSDLVFPLVLYGGFSEQHVELTNNISVIVQVTAD